LQWLKANHKNLPNAKDQPFSLVRQQRRRSNELLSFYFQGFKSDQGRPQPARWTWTRKCLEGGGNEIACGWLKDKFGLYWQITPIVLPELLSDPDRAKACRVMQAMMKMIKLDIAGLKAAAEAK
jgi:predicted 3-demethylubiquinone-9 3-methyltransferase (glyoxalase superfamily)